MSIISIVSVIILLVGAFLMLPTLMAMPKIIESVEILKHRRILHLLRIIKLFFFLGLLYSVYNALNGEPYPIILNLLLLAGALCFYLMVKYTLDDKKNEQEAGSMESNSIEFVEAQEEIRCLNKKLKARDKQLEQFTYIASHDLQEPLKTIDSFIRLLEEEYGENLDEQAKVYLKYISGSSSRMSELIKSLQDHVLLGLKKEPENIDCTELVKEIIQEMSGFIDANNAKIEISELPVIVAYRDELKLLFQQLIHNAIKFRKKDSTPTVSIFANEEENNWVFGVQDNGIGIEKQFFEKIFEIFQRLHTRSEYDGNGIGLAHCRRIAELHNGNIWLDSKPGTGSIFYFSIQSL